MATAKGGFDCDFIEPPPKSLECPICLLTLRDPHVISCCGNHFCRPCIQRIQQDGKPCPLCNDPDFTVLLHKGVMREVNALIVRCPQKELGCQWVGELGKIQQHLSPGAGVKGGGCGYVEVECAYQCGGRFQRHTIHEHELEFCPNRPLEMQLSSMTKKLTAALAENHSLKEEIAQVKEKQEQEMRCLAEKLEAALQVIRVEKDEMKAENVAVKKRLSQLEEKERRRATSASVQTNLSQEHQAMKRELAQLEQTQKATALECQSLKVKQDGVESKCMFLESRLTPVPPFYFTMADFEWWKKERLLYISDPFYSHPSGYKMQVEVDARGYDSGKGTHVSVYVCLMRGEYDDKLPWPFQGKVTIQIYNRNSESWGFEKTITFRDAPAKSNCRPPSNGISNPGQGYHKFVAHGELSLLPFPNDIVRFRVIKVEV